MLEPIHVLRLSVAALAVAIGVMWVKAWGARTWDRRVDFAYPHLGIPWKNGQAELNDVEIVIDERKSRFLKFRLTIRPPDTGTYFQVYGPSSQDSIEFRTNPETVGAWLAEMEQLDFLMGHECTIVSDYHHSREWTLRVGHRVRRYDDVHVDPRRQRKSPREHEWHTRLDQLYVRITRDVNVAQWQIESSR